MVGDGAFNYKIDYVREGLKKTIQSLTAVIPTLDPPPNFAIKKTQNNSQTFFDKN